jgi:hypothetical protein
MSLLQLLRDTLAPARRRTQVQEASPSDGSAYQPADLPPFTLYVADQMRFDPQVRIGLGARNGLLMSAEMEVVGPDRQVVRWVERQWQRIWSSAAHQLLRTKLYGFMPFEVFYRQSRGGEFDGAIEFERLKDHDPRQARLLVDGDQPAGFVIRDPQREARYLAPRALVTTFDAVCTNPYGCALLARAYPPWYEKWMEGGAKRTLRLRMMKDAYVGDIIWYPADRKITLPNGTDVSWRDIARELAEARQTGGALTLPLLYDRDGHRLVDYTPPRDTGGATQIFHWQREVDLEIWKALEVPPEIIQASTSGSGFAGRWIPFVVALSSVHLELAELVRCIDRDILRPLAQWNFGHDRYEIRPRSLVDVYAAKFGPQHVIRANAEELQGTV